MIHKFDRVPVFTSKIILGLWGICLLWQTPYSRLLAQIPAKPQQQPIALVGGTIHTMAGQTLENGILLFDHGVITALGTEVAIPEQAQRIEVTGKHIYPGLIDVSTNLGLFENSALQQATDTNEDGTFNPNVRAEVAFHPASRHIGVARSAGVLIAVSNPSGGIISGYASTMNLDGWTWEQMSLKGQTAMVLNWPSPADDTRYAASIKELKGQFADARAYLETRRSDPSAMDAGLRQETDLRWLAMEPVLKGDVPVVVNANDLRQIQDSIRFATDQKIRIVIRGGRSSGMIAKQLADQGVGLILTTVLNSPSFGWQGYDDVYSLPAKLHEAGVKFAISGAESAQYVNRTPFEAGAAVAYGLPEEVAIRALTIHAAELLGIDDRVGSLEVGKDATIIVTNGSPIEYATQVEAAFIQGRQIDMSDIHKEFYQKYRLRLD